MVSGELLKMADKRNIVLVINDLKGNGAERVVITLAKGFTDAGHRASIVCFKDHVELPIPSGIPIYIFSEKYFRWIPRSIRGRLTAPFLDCFIRNKIGLPDLLLSNLMPSDRILAHSRLANIFFIVHNTMSNESSSTYRPNRNNDDKERQRIYIRKPCICVSKGVEEDLRKFLTKSTKYYITTIHNPIDTTQVAIAAEEEKNDIIPDAIIHVGKFKRQKRQDRLIRAYHASKCSYPLVFVGNGELLTEAKILVSNLQLEDKVHFLGFRKNPYPYIKAARLLVLCSDFEGLGMVLLESISLDTPAISSDCPSGPNEVLPRPNLFQVDDFEDMVKLLKQASMNPNEYKAHVRENFLMQSSISKYLKLSFVDK